MPLELTYFDYVTSLPGEGINLASSAMSGINPEGTSSDDLEIRLAKMYGVEKEQVIVTPSCTFSSFFVLYALQKKISRVVTIAPEYPVYYYQSKQIGIDVTLENRLSDDGLDLSPWDVEEGTAYCISNPNNPTGLSWSDESLKSIARETEGNESYLVIDDTFSLFQGQYARRLEAGNTIVIGSISKFFGESGIKMGWIVSKREIIEEMKEKMNYVVPVISSAVKRRGSYLFTNMNVYGEYNKKKLEANSKILFDNLDEHILGYKGSVINTISVGGGSTQFALSLLGEGVMTAPGFYFGSDTLVRIGIGTEEPERVEKGVKIVSEKLKKLTR